MTDLRLYNTLTRTTEILPRPADGAPVKLYACGPTVYNYLHAGNYRTYIFEDVLKRTLKLLGYPVRHVMNITDVGHLTSDADEGEDKLEVGAKREGRSAWDIARFYEDTFLADIKKLRIDFTPEGNPPRADDGRVADILCRATEHIEEQMRLVDRLIEKGLTYETKDGIYFDTAKFPDYGRMAGAAHISGLESGSRVAMGEKRSGTDFALWKFSPEGAARQMEWDYRGRKGFPGWHIECSAMGMAYLGESFDIHCGGVDHIPIHHTNEIAQAEAATGKPFVRRWLHGEFLVMNKAKMAKSSGGFIRLADLEAKGLHPLDYRCFCFGAHYRRQLDFSWEGLEAAKTARRRLKDKVQEWLKSGLGRGGELNSPNEPEEWLGKFKEALADDLNVPQALACVHDALAAMESTGDRLEFLKETEKVLALGLFEAEEERALAPDLRKVFDDYVAARKEKNWAASDALRTRLKESGIQVLDGKDGSRWKRL